MAPFWLPGNEDVYQSRLVIGPFGAGSRDLLVNHFTVAPGKGLASHIHPDNDELYYILSGRGFVELAASDTLEDVKRYDVHPGVAAFIPASCSHRIQNTSDSPLVMLTIWPRLPEPGSNPIYDARLAAWGTMFKVVDT